MTIPLNALKEISAASIFFIGLLAALAPLSVMNLSDSLFSIGNMMASGVLLAAGLVHQLPDAAAVLDGGRFPWSTFIAGLTFITVLIIEETVHILFGEVGGESGEGGVGDSLCHNHGHGHQHNDSSSRGIGIGDGGSGVDDYRRKRDKDGHHHSYRSHEHHHGEHEHEKQPLIISPSSTIQQTHHQHQQRPSFALDRSISACSETQHSHHHHDEHISQHLHGSILAASVLLLSLSIHSTLAGLSIGIATKSSEVTSTAVAILAHKFFEGYALGSSMVTAEMAVERIFVLGTMFSLMAPLGIILGMSFTYHADEVDDDVDDGDDTIWLAIIQSMVAGTFLYVSIVEVGMKELLMCRHDDTVQGGGKYDMTLKQVEAAKLFFFLVGFLAFSALAFYI